MASLAEDIPRARPGQTDLVANTILTGGTYQIDEGTPWTETKPDALEGPLPTFDADHPLIRSLDESMRRVSEVTEGQAYVGIPYCGVDPLTLLSLFLGASELCEQLVENPEIVSRWLDASTSQFVAYHAYFHDLSRQLGYGQGNAWYRLTAPGHFEAAQCDFAVMLSPKMFEQFALPMLEEITNAADYSLYHLDGVEQVRFLDLLAKLPKLHGIQWNPQPGEKTYEKWIGTLRGIRERGWLLLLNEWDISIDDAMFLTRELGPDGLFLSLRPFNSVPEAEAAVRAIEEACRSRRSAPASMSTAERAAVGSVGSP